MSPADRPENRLSAAPPRAPRNPPRRDWVLTTRGRRAISITVGVGLLGIGVAAVQHREPSRQVAQAVPAVTGSAVAPIATNPTSTSAKSSPSTSARPTSPASVTASQFSGRGVDAQGFMHSGVAASGQFAASNISIAAAQETTNKHTFIVRVETSLSLDANSVARTVAGILNDPRSWVGTATGRTKGASFELVSDPAKAQLTINVAAPQTVDKLCPLDTKSQVSCDDAAHVLLNYDRWTFATPSTPDVTSYRQYLVNHEVGHFLGMGHQPCPGAGKPAPVMLQQTKGLMGCLANPWPTVNP